METKERQALGIMLADDWKWRKVLEAYPLSEKKINVISKRGNDTVNKGIMTDHIMGIARKLGVPNVYIKRLRYYRDRYKRHRHLPTAYKYRSAAYLETYYLLDAILEIMAKEKKGEVVDRPAQEQPI